VASAAREDATEPIRAVRQLPESPERVFRAWTDPDEFARWWRPGPYTTTSVEMAVRVGGNYRVVMQAPDGRIQELFGTYVEVQPPSRLVFTFALRGSPKDDGYTAIVSIDFRPHLNGTELILVHERIPAASRPLFATGWDVVLGRLLDHFTPQNRSGCGV